MEKILQNKKIRLLLACISLFLLIDLVQDTYAKYVSSADANGAFTIARWAFTVNDQDIIANSDFSSTIVPQIDSNANISSGVIAPTSTGSFEIEIDSSEVGVAFNETITLDQADDNTVTDLVFTGYQLNNDPVVSLNNVTTATINSTHQLNEVNNVNTYTIFIAWRDGNGETMDNESDTDASIDGTAAVAVNINFVQRALTPVSPTPDPDPEPDPEPEP